MATKNRQPIGPPMDLANIREQRASFDLDGRVGARAGDQPAAKRSQVSQNDA